MKKLIRVIFLLSISSNIALYTMDPPDSKLNEQPPRKKMRVESPQSTPPVSEESIEPPRKRQKTMFSEQQILDALKENNQNIINTWMKEQFIGEGVQPIHKAAREGYLALVKWLAVHGADVNAQDEDGVQPIHWAARGGNLPIVEYFVARGADVNAQDEDGVQPIHWAARNGHLAVVKWLVAHGADVNAQDFGNCQPIHEAVRNSHLAVAKWLVSHGADVNAQDQHGSQPIHWAAFEGHFALIEWLASHGADINAQNQDGYQPIHLAAQKGHFAIIEWLVSHGTDVNIQDLSGNQPIHLAAFEGHLAIVEWLVAHGADISVQDILGYQSIHWAARNGHLPLIEWLTAHGADLSAQNKDHQQPILSAARNGHLAVVKWLIAHGADVNAQDNNGNYLTSKVAQKGHIDLLKCLLFNGASIYQLSNTFIQTVPFLQHITNALHSCVIEDTDSLSYVLVQLVTQNEIEKIDAILKSHKNNISPEILQHLILVFTRNFIAWLSNPNSTINHQDLHARFQTLTKLLLHGSPKAALLFLIQQRHRIFSQKPKAVIEQLYHLLLSSSRLRLFDLALFNLTRREISYQQIDQEIQRLPTDLVEILFQIRNLASKNQFHLLRQSIQNYNTRTFNTLFRLSRPTLSQLHIQNLLHFVATNDLTQLNTQAITNIITTLISAGGNPSTLAVDQTPLLDWLHSMLQQDLFLDTIIDTQISQRRQLIVNLLQGNDLETTPIETNTTPQFQRPNVNGNQLRETTLTILNLPVSMID